MNLFENHINQSTVGQAWNLVMNNRQEIDSIATPNADGAWLIKTRIKNGAIKAEDGWTLAHSYELSNSEAAVALLTIVLSGGAKVDSVLVFIAVSVQSALLAALEDNPNPSAACVNIELIADGGIAVECLTK